MSNIDRRLGKIEELLNVGREKTVIHNILHLTYREGTAPNIPEPCEDWITYKRALKEAVEQGNVTGLEALLFEVDPFREYEVRNGLPEGTLSKHKLKGEMPFDQLLEEVTKSSKGTRQ
jgi:hypothetical protein